MIGPPDTDYTIIGTRKDTSHINKYEVVDDTRDSLYMPIGAVTIYMLYVIRLWTLHFVLPKSVLNWKFCHIYLLSSGDYSTAPELYVRLYLYVCESYNGVCIDIFVHIITVSVLLCLCMLYNLIGGYTSSWYFVPYLSCAWVIPPLYHSYICVYINICFCTPYFLLLGCATSCKLRHAYLLYIICYTIVVVLVDPH